MIKQTNAIQIALYSLLLSMSLISLYPFYIVPIQNILFSSHTVAKILICFSLLILVLSKFSSIQSSINKNKLLYMFLLSYVLGQSLSVISAVDTIAFFKTYHNIIIYIFIFLTIFLILNEAKDKIKVITSFSINLAVLLVFSELFVRIFWNYISSFFSFIVQKEVVDAYFFNLSQGKQSLAQGNERFLPFLLLIFAGKVREGAFYKSLIFLALLISIALSFLSNFRTRLVILVLSFIPFTAFLVKDRFIKKINHSQLLKIGAGAVLVLTVGYITLSLSNSLYSFNVVDRFLLENQPQDLGSINTRIDQIQNSIELFGAYPFFGVGLGNYPNYFSSKLIASPFEKAGDISFSELSASRPHSIVFQLLGETGLFGLSSFVALLCFFIFTDYKILHTHEIEIVWPFMISSWLIIVYGLFNPLDTVFTFGWFWFCRGVIQGYLSSDIRNDVVIKHKVRS